MNKFPTNQEVKTKLYKQERYSEFATPQSGRKLAIARRVAGISTSNFVNRPHRIAADTVSSSRLVGRENASQRGVRDMQI